MDITDESPMDSLKSPLDQRDAEKEDKKEEEEGRKRKGKSGFGEESK